MKNEIVHFTIEDISSGLFQRQVLGITKSIYLKNQNLKFQILVVNRIWHYQRNKRDLKKIRKELKGFPIRIKYVPLLPPLRFALKSVSYSKIVTLILKSCAHLLIPRSAEIIHCRSYWPTIAALRAGFTNVIFDMRSLMPLESVSTGDLVENSPSYNYWIREEKYCVENALVSTGVSQGMIDYNNRIVPNSKSRLIPISVDIEHFKFNKEVRVIKRKELQWNDSFILVYSGSLGQSGVNIETLFSMIVKILTSSSMRKILFLTMEPPNLIKSILSKYGIKSEMYKIVHPSFAEMGEWLSAADVGIHALPKQLDWKTRLGTKVVEYWSNGLPTIVNKYVGAAAKLTKDNDLGIVYDERAPITEFNDQLEKLKTKRRCQQSDFAMKHFSSNLIAQKYSEVYQLGFKEPLK